MGRDDLDVGRHLWTRDVEFTGEEWHVRQREHTFLVLVDREFEAVVTHADVEPIVGAEWFDAVRLRELGETMYPEDLADRLEAVLSERDQGSAPVATGRSGSDDQSDHDPS